MTAGSENREAALQMAVKWAAGGEWTFAQVVHAAEAFRKYVEAGEIYSNLPKSK